MKSIKPGRGPSGMSFIGSIIAIVFGVFWTIIAFRMTANTPFGMVGSIFPLFGILFIVMGIIQAAYHYKNATSKNRFSVFDIADSSEEGDPADKWIKVKDNYQSTYQEDHDSYYDSRKQKINDARTSNKDLKNKDTNYCPYCGKSLSEDFSFCPGCGKRCRGIAK